ncbi:MAG: helix-turn-helix transcriptional regulator [Eubacterium sp.]|nr:helix-turn-helix transcriptional regulator [Eubacterium sp.]
MRFVIKEEREKKGITIKELAEKTGLSEGIIQELEENRVNLFNSRDVSEIAKVLDVSVEKLFFDDSV